MTQTDYVVKRIGDSYVPAPAAGSAQAGDQVLISLAGVALTLAGLHRRGFFGWSAALAGAAILWHACNQAQSRQTATEDLKASDVRADLQSEDSFPASDPPASTTSTASGSLQEQVG